MSASQLKGKSFMCTYRAPLAGPSPLKLQTLRHTSTSVSATASAANVLTLESGSSSLQLGSLVASRWPNPDEFALPPAAVSIAAVETSLLRRDQAASVQQVSAEIARLMTELDAELNAFTAATSGGTLPRELKQQPQATCLLGSHLRPSEPSTSVSSGIACVVGGTPNPASARVFDPLALAGTSASSRPAGLLPQLSLSLPSAQQSAAARSRGGEAAASGAGSRAERRRQKIRRSAAALAVNDAPTHEAKYKANGSGSMSILMGSFSKDHILSAEEEQLLASAAQDFMQLAGLQRLLAAVLKRPPSMGEMAKSLQCDEASLRVRMDCGSRARTLLAQKNYRLVVNIAKRMVRSAGAGAGGGAPAGSAARPAGAAGAGGGGSGATASGDNGVSLDDAITVGMEALMYAIRKFKPEAGYRLSTYATWWIRLHVSRLVQAQAGVVTISVYQRAKLDRIRSARAKLRAVLPPGVSPSRQQLAEASGLSVAQVAELEVAERTMVVGTRSFEAPLSDGDKASTVEDLVAQDVDSETTEGLGSSLLLDSEDFAASASLSAAVEGLLSSLDRHEAELLRRRYGLGPETSPAAATGEDNAAAAEPRKIQDRESVEPDDTAAAAAGGALAAAEGGKAGAESGASRLELNPKRRVSARRVLQKLRLRLDDESGLAEWLELKSGRSNLAMRTAGYAKKSG